MRVQGKSAACTVLCMLAVSGAVPAREATENSPVYVAQAAALDQLYVHLVGAWRNSSGSDEQLRYEFAADGSFSYAALFSAYDIYIHETGTYRIGSEGLTLMPSRKLYRRRGVESLDVPKMRVFAWRTYSQGGRRNLLLQANGSTQAFIEE